MKRLYEIYLARQRLYQAAWPSGARLRAAPEPYLQPASMRGAIGVTERQVLLCRHAIQAKAVSELYVEQRHGASPCGWPTKKGAKETRERENAQSPNLHPTSTPQSFVPNSA